jgi:hypothetical protein
MSGATGAIAVLALSSRAARQVALKNKSEIGPAIRKTGI